MEAAALAPSRLMVQGLASNAAEEHGTGQRK